jgi:hypothetical protein
MDAGAIEVVVVYLVSSKHEAVQAHVVHEHFLELYALLTHILVIDNLVGHFCIARGIQLSFY